eukprot:892851-Pelagomonas_calceolata.AAC.1
MPASCTTAPRSTPAGFQKQFSRTPAAARPGNLFAAPLAAVNQLAGHSIVTKWSHYLGSISN